MAISCISLLGQCRILSLDSSGGMAVIQLEALSQIEQASGKRTIETFDWIVASGVGAFLVMAMVPRTLPTTPTTCDLDFSGEVPGSMSNPVH